ncbi:MAG TPA: HD-GYP domain-containing protein [Firmicutes bacterium]|jgi:putative nucleotidyltransferase with HDIG domain|nr:HD-GYP domain-containing protein [Bacillota bacterium]
MKRKPLIMQLGSISALYFFGAYMVYYKLNVSTVLLPQEVGAFFALVFLLWLLFIVFIRYYLLLFRKKLQKQDNIHQKNLAKLNNTYKGTIQALIKALDCRDHATWNHSMRVVGYATAIAEAMGLDEKEQEKLALAGFLHDIGKIGVPDRILLKKTKLLPEEWEAIKRHPELGYNIINQIEFLSDAADIILHHHEHYDGSGYPLGLKEEKIPLTARIFAVADALDAMTSDRPYRSARTMEEAVNEVYSLAGKQFCPQCVKVLEKIGVEKLSWIQQVVKKDGVFKYRLEELIRCS